VSETSIRMPPATTSLIVAVLQVDAAGQDEESGAGERQGGVLPVVDSCRGRSRERASASRALLSTDDYAVGAVD
jgi:hypothetical protein